MNKERTILYLFSINAIIYIASGFYTPFLSAYYAQKGIDAEKIGILLMIGPCVVLLTQRFWAKISDRTGKRKEVLLVTIVGSGFSMLLYYLGNSFLCMFFATVVVTSFTTAVIPLLMAGITTLMTICALIVYFWKNREQRNGGDVCEI